MRLRVEVGQAVAVLGPAGDDPAVVVLGLAAGDPAVVVLVQVEAGPAMVALAAQVAAAATGHPVAVAEAEAPVVVDVAVATGRHRAAEAAVDEQLMSGYGTANGRLMPRATGNATPLSVRSSQNRYPMPPRITSVSRL